MKSYGEPGCVDCYREHCRQQAPSLWVAAVTPDCRRLSSQRRGANRIASSRRFDFVHRSCRLFIAGSFVIGLILVPCTMSAPVKELSEQEQQQRRQQQTGPAHPSSSPPSTSNSNTTPFWYNPCGITTQMTAADGSGSGHDMMLMEPESATRHEKDIIDGIILSASHALSHTEQFTGSLVVETLGNDIKQVHEVWKGTTLTWLKLAEYMPKQLDEPLSKSYLATLTLREVLPAVYIGMQNLAVGLEQMVWDMEKEQLSFAKDLKDTTHKLRALLCEMSMAMYELNETEYHVSRNIMTPEYRTQENRPLRDWLILREYITSLQYVIQAFEYLKSKR